MKNNSKENNIYDKTLSLCENPFFVQNQFLMEAISSNINCEYGKKYNFEKIINYQEYTKNVPIIEYSDIEDLIHEQFNNKNLTILSNEKFVFGYESSGTSGKPKIIPYTKTSQTINDKYISSYMLDMIKCTINGGIDNYFLVNLATCDSDYYRNRNHCISDTFITRMLPFWEKINCVPMEACFLWDKCDHMYLKARYSLECQNPTVFYVDYISEVERFIDYITHNKELIIRDIKEGKINSNIICQVK